MDILLSVKIAKRLSWIDTVPAARWETGWCSLFNSSSVRSLNLAAIVKDVGGALCEMVTSSIREAHVKADIITRISIGIPATDNTISNAIEFDITADIVSFHTTKSQQRGFFFQTFFFFTASDVRVITVTGFGLAYIHLNNQLFSLLIEINRNTNPTLGQT